MKSSAPMARKRLLHVPYGKKLTAAVAQVMAACA